MKHFSLSRFFLQAGTLLLAGLVFVQSAFAQKYTLGPLDLVSDRTLPASFRSMLMAADFGSFCFNRSVGGICFEQTAVPDPSLSRKPIKLHVRNNRLDIDVAGQTYVADLPLWQLLPIAAYVDSGKAVAFTAYGENVYPDKEVSFVYHPAFLDNLLGLRFCQADIIFNGMTGGIESLLRKQIDPTWELFCRLSGENEAAFRQKLADDFAAQGIPGVTAENVKQIWADKAVELAKLLLGEPEGYTWDLPRRDGTVVCAPSESKWRDPDREQKEQIGKEIMQALYGNEDWNSYILTDHDRPITFGLRNGSVVFTGNPYYRFTLLDESTQSVAYKEQVSSLFDALWNRLKEYNPAVMTAVENTAHWSAFFRYVKQTKPEQWRRFVDELRAVRSDAPEVYTPTRYELRQQNIF